MTLKIDLKKIYTFVAILAPVLSVYGISRSANTFTFRDLLILVVLYLCILNLIRQRKLITSNVSKATIVFLFFVTLSFCINAMLGATGFELRTIRYMILIIYIFCFAEKYFDYEYGEKIYKYVVIIASIFVFAQVISSNVFSYPLKGYLSFLPIRSYNLMHSDMLRRFYSIFEEPGYYGMFASGYLVISLFSKKKEILTLLMIALASLLTTSTTSIVTLLFVAGIFLILKDRPTAYEHNNRWHWRLKFIIIVVIFISVVIFLNSDQYETVMYRLNYETSTVDRFSGYSEFISIYSNSNVLIKMFGNCLQSYPISGYVAILLAFGVIGSLALLSIIVVSFVKTHYVGKILVLLFLFINIGNVEFMGNASTILVFFGFVLTAPHLSNSTERSVCKK